MKVPNVSSAVNLILFCCLLGFFGCEREVFEPTPQPHPTGIQALATDPGQQSNLDSIDPGCSGTRTFTVPYSIVSTDAFPGYQLAIQLNPGGSILQIPDISEGCRCYIDYYCITISFPQEFVGGAALRSIQDSEVNMHPVDMDGNGGYYTPFYNKGNTGGNPQVHRLCLTPAELNQALFKLPYGFPTGYDASNAVITVSGICTVDNLPTPVDPNNS